MKKIFTSLRIPTTLIAILALSACAQNEVKPADIVGSWKIKQIGDQVINTERAEMTFSTQGSVSGNNGCNNMMGQYSPVHDHLNLSGFSLTRMACHGQAAADALLFNTALDKIEHFLIKGDQLFLTDEQDKTVISLSR